MKVQPYVFFDGKCEEELEFYKRAIGAKVNALMRFGEAPDQKVYDDLRALKQVLETGEVVHSDASIHEHPHPARPAAQHTERHA